MRLDPVPFGELANATLELDRVYKGGVSGHAGDDPIARLIPVGNQGGIRFAGSPHVGTCKLVALFTSGEDPDWPDSLDVLTGRLVYFGDNKHLGDSFTTPHGAAISFSRRCSKLCTQNPLKERPSHRSSSSKRSLAETFGSEGLLLQELRKDSPWTISRRCGGRLKGRDFRIIVPRSRCSMPGR